MSEYKELVNKMAQKEEKVSTDFLGEAMKHIGVSE
jgi:hypothetical protein